MIYEKDNVIQKIMAWKRNTIHIVADFDRTITDGFTDTSWSLLSKFGIVPKEYINKRQILYDKYRKFEIDTTLDDDFKNEMMSEWWKQHMEILIEYKINKKMFNGVIKSGVMKFRDKADVFLKMANDMSIPIIIISAGLKIFIDAFLEQNNCNYDNIYVLSNEFIFDENGTINKTAENIIHALNKNEISLPINIKRKIEDRPNILLLGDGINDIKMISEDRIKNAIKVGFLNEEKESNIKAFKENFDVVITENGSFSRIIELLENI